MDCLLLPLIPIAPLPVPVAVPENLDFQWSLGRVAFKHIPAFYSGLSVATKHYSSTFRRAEAGGFRRVDAGGRLLPLTVVCSSCKGPNSSSNSTGRWDDDDGDYVEAHVLEAVSLLPSHGQLFMTFDNGGEVEIEHINPAKGRLLYRSRNPTIFLKIDDESNLLLPIVVGEVAIMMLMKALHGDEKAGRPNHYHLIKDLVGALNHEVRMVRVTERVIDTYYSRVYFGKPGEEEMQSVDARPSDAINLAIRCKVPIYVNKSIVAADAVRPIYTTRTSGSMAEGSVKAGNSSSLDCPVSGSDPIAEEINLMKNMLLAVVEERYADAARWRDDLDKLRASRRQIR